VATEEGIVIQVSPPTARIKTTRSGACESCASRGSCSTIGGGKEMEVEALNPVGAKVGDCVVINFESSALLKISFLLYVFPILCMIAGAVLGQQLAPLLNLKGSTASIIFAILFFMLAFGFIKFRSTRMAQKDIYRPKITRVLKRADSL